MQRPIRKEYIEILTRDASLFLPTKFHASGLHKVICFEHVYKQPQLFTRMRWDFQSSPIAIQWSWKFCVRFFLTKSNSWYQDKIKGLSAFVISFIVFFCRVESSVRNRTKVEQTPRVVHEAKLLIFTVKVWQNHVLDIVGHFLKRMDGVSNVTPTRRLFDLHT